MKNTSPPWKLYTNNLERGWQILSDADFQIASIDTKYRSFEENEANAKLIVMAPLMLQELQRIFEKYGYAETLEVIKQATS